MKIRNLKNYVRSIVNQQKLKQFNNFQRKQYEHTTQFKTLMEMILSRHMLQTLILAAKKKEAIWTGKTLNNLRKKVVFMSIICSFLKHKAKLNYKLKTIFKFLKSSFKIFIIYNILYQFLTQKLCFPECEQWSFYQNEVPYVKFFIFFLENKL